MKLTAALALGALSLTACGGHWTMRDTRTIASPDATRIWLIQTDPAGSERVVFCDRAFLSAPQNPALCTRWPLIQMQAQ